MFPNLAQARSRQGFTLIEIAIMCALLALLVGGVTSSFWTVQAAFDEEVTDAELTFRSRSAMDRLVQLTSTAVTSDAAFALFGDTAGGPYSVLRFRELDTVVAGVANYDDNLVVHLVGTNFGVAACTGIVIGRGPDLGAVSVLGSGADGTLGTLDDDIAAGFAAGSPAVELLIPPAFAPQNGPMLDFTDTASASGRLVTITLRANFRRPDGTFLRATDFVLIERVALRW